MRAQTIKSLTSKTNDPIIRFSLRPWWSRLLKRVFDLVISGLGLLFLSPVFGLLSIAIQRDSPGPVYYRGLRLGRGDKPFSILKFRTMREEAASYAGPRLTAEDDTRITPLGKWLRDTKINELPQLWNVFVGEMSLVGPRPEDPSLAKTWPLDVRAEVLSMRPGITSPASVLYRDEEKMLSGRRLMDTYLGEILPSKLRLDQLYVRHHSNLLDLDVLFWTFLVVVVPNLRDHKPPEEYLFWGPISRLGRRYLNWFFIDTITTLVAFGLVGLYWRVFVGPLDMGLLPAVLIVGIYSILFSSMAALTGVQKISWSSASAGDIVELLPPILLAFLVAFAINFWLHFLPNHIVLEATALAFFGYVFMRYRSRLLTGFLSRWINLRKDGMTVRERVLIVGAGDAGQFAAWRLIHSQEEAHFRVVGFVDDDMFSRGERLKGVSILGNRKDIPDLVKKHDIGIIVFAIHNISALERRVILKACRGTGARVITWPDMLRLIRSQPETEALTCDQSEARPCPARFLNSDVICKSHVDNWLMRLENGFQEGDFAQVLSHIHSMRASLDVPQQIGED